MKRSNSEIERSKDLERRLQDLNKRHGRDQAGKEEAEKSGPAKAGIGNAFRLSSEFISAILVGTAIGYGIDWLAGTSPWGMIVFLMLGFVAGILNVLRASGEMVSPSEDKPDASGRQNENK